MALYKKKRDSGFDKRALREGFVNVTKSEHVTKRSSMMYTILNKSKFAPGFVLEPYI